MSFLRLLVLFLILSFICKAQNLGYKPGQKPLEIKKPTEIDIIKSIPISIFSEALKNDVYKINECISKNIDTSGDLSNNDTTSFYLMHIDSIIASVSNNNAVTMSNYRQIYREEKEGDNVSTSFPR